MKFTHFVNFLALLCFYLPVASNAIRKQLKLHPGLGGPCKQSETNLTQCYCSKFDKIVPLLKDGYPEMHVDPIDPKLLEHIKMDFTSTQSLRANADLYNVSIRGLSSGDVIACQADFTEDGIHIYMEMLYHLITLESKYKVVGDVLLLHLDSNGNFSGKFRELLIKSDWKTTRYMKKDKVHLKFDSEIISMDIKNITIQFTNLFHDQTALNDEFNKAVNDNIDLLYNDVSPIILKSIQEIVTQGINNVYAAFPFDVLYPPDK